MPTDLDDTAYWTTTTTAYNTQEINRAYRRIVYDYGDLYETEILDNLNEKQPQNKYDQEKQKLDI